MIGIESLLLFIGFGCLIYKYFSRNLDYWKKRNVPYEKPLPFFGNYFAIMTLRVTIGDYFSKLYNQFQCPYFGVFVLNKPALVIKSKELIKAILVKDFKYFCDHTFLSDERCDSLVSKTLFVVKNPEWKIIRAKMTPAFTSARIKAMSGLINDVSHKMVEYINKKSNRNSIEAKELCTKYVTDVIATCAFGIDAGSFENDNAEFRVIGRRIFDFGWETAFRQTSYLMVPELVKLFRFTVFKRGVNDFFRNVFWEAIQHREETGIRRNDLIDIIIKMKKRPDPSIDFTGDRVVAQAALFFIAAIESTSATMAFTLYELCLSSKIQNKARTEILEVLREHGHLTYEAIQDLKYLQMIIYETLRKYPALPFLDRLCVEDYKLPGTDLLIEKGTSVYIPLFGIHHDPEIYPEPEKYEPGRFSKENAESLPDFSFLPFGEGPRNCIGERFGLLTAKLGLARILLEYKLEKSSDTPFQLEFEVKSLLLAAKNGLPVKFTKII